ncbi:hypothetical protein K450DRAFT_282291 [Umbelopsis ramanniana AG]|uniref:DDRGK domain-containing protein 1 n=1 Tax=Umbelopsis ramanniana AG TaxID=1314678 RepID=A0AAD5E7N3_UMBRA|nr:uncharacterized protein K450DRAFT_282291 [Umbelopsis ramanniana AG]KAI8577835.1 hypothetical protein K450DRAFT_282291 [Umbelopsis ramanniana AG]
MAESNNPVPLITFIPVVICCIAIVLLLQHRSSQQRDRVNEADAAAIAQLYQDAEMDELEEEEEVEESVMGDGDQDSDPQEGTSTAVRVKKVGKKRAEKLKRKEHMRQYREYLDSQREARKYNDEIEEERYRQRKIAESIEREREHEKRLKAQAQQQQKLDKEREKKHKLEEKEQKRLQNILQKYRDKIKRTVQDCKYTTIEQLSKAIHISDQDTIYILKQLLIDDPQFRLSLFEESNMSFLYVTDEDYARLNAYMQKTGYFSIEKDAENIISILTQ